METLLSMDSVGLFLLAVFPGLVSLHVYRLILPAHPIRWSDIAVQGLFYSLLNFGLLFPLVLFAANVANQDSHPVGYWLSIAILLVGAPCVWPLLLRSLLNAKWIRTRVQLPYPTAWDFFFGRREPCFVLLTLSDGTRLGGYWGPLSYATSFPNDGDIYLEAVFRVEGDGVFHERVPGTLGTLVRKDQYKYIELFEMPQETSEGADVENE
jgi:hypothetical protein